MLIKKRHLAVIVLKNKGIENGLDRTISYICSYHITFVYFMFCDSMYIKNH